MSVHLWDRNLSALLKERIGTLPRLGFFIKRRKQIPGFLFSLPDRLQAQIPYDIPITIATSLRRETRWHTASMMKGKRVPDSAPTPIFWLYNPRLWLPDGLRISRAGEARWPSFDPQTPLVPLCSVDCGVCRWSICVNPMPHLDI
jgi:hypothetical protein